MSVIDVYSKSPCFTQGLYYHSPTDLLYESSGLYGKSFLRNSHKTMNLSYNIFAEDITYYHNNLYQLTYRENMILQWNPDLDIINVYHYPYSGWGICEYRDRFYTTDGSSQLHKMDPSRVTTIQDIPITDGGEPVDRINAMCVKDDWIYGNRWMTSLIYKINPFTGKVETKWDFSEIVPENAGPEDCLNGITVYRDGFLITGKNWNRLYFCKMI